MARPADVTSDVTADVIADGTIAPAVPLQWNATDIDVGVRLTGALMRHASATGGASIAPADLLGLARKAHPRDAMLGRAVVLGIAPKLAFVSAFCRQYGYPDLAGLAGATPPGPAVAAYDWTGAAGAAYDWTGAAGACAPQLAAFAKAAHAAVPARFKARAERPADVAWYAYFRSHRAACDAVSLDGKKEIINLIMAGLDPEAALARVLAAQG